MKTSSGNPLNLENTKCHAWPPCLAQGVYLVTYVDKNSYGVEKVLKDENGELIGDGLVTYGACEGHINQMRLGYNDMEYVSDRKVWYC